MSSTEKETVTVEDAAVTALIEWLDEEATHEIESAQELTDLGKIIRQHETTARRMARQLNIRV